MPLTGITKVTLRGKLDDRQRFSADRLKNAAGPSGKTRCEAIRLRMCL